MSNQMRLEKDIMKKENSRIKENRDPLADNGKKKGKEERPATKVVVRRLPPSMTLEQFIEQVSPLPPTDYMYFVQADMSLTPHCFSRAYLNFVNQEDLFIFTQKFDNYVFVDSKGMEYPAVVEFAPFQRIPKHRPNRKKDSKMGTLETDPIFISFKEKLEAEMLENKSAANAVKQHFFETSSVTNEKKEISTPLLDFIRNRRVERQRIRDEKRDEKRKKDLERRRAKDEQRKTKKDEDSAVMKPKDLKYSLSEEDPSLPKKSVPNSLDKQSACHTDNKKPLSCDPNIPKGTPFSVSSLQKCLLEFQKNILITSQINKMNKAKEDLPNEDKNELKLGNNKHQLELFYNTLHSNQNQIGKPSLNDNFDYKNDINIETSAVNPTNIGSGDSPLRTNIKQELMQFSILKNPINYDVQCVKNGFHENSKVNFLNDDKVQIMKPLHRFAQISVEKSLLSKEVEKEKIYNKNLRHNLNKIVETVFKKTPEVNNQYNKKSREDLININVDLTNITELKESKLVDDDLKKKDFLGFSKVVRLQSPRPIKSLVPKTLSSITLNEKFIEPCIEERTMNTVTKVWGHGLRTFPRRPHTHTSKIYFPISKKAKA